LKLDDAKGAQNGSSLHPSERCVLETYRRSALGLQLADQTTLLSDGCPKSIKILRLCVRHGSRENKI
jgi:hypothetical protein